MEPTPLRKIVVLACLLWTAGAHAAQITWTLPATYRDGRPLDPVDARRIVVEVYAGPTKSGPWEPVAASYPGGTAAIVPDPPLARTRWYTVRAVLDGASSEFAAPVHMTNYSLPVPPFVRRLARRVIRSRKLLFVTAALPAGLVLALALWIGARRRRQRTGKL